MHLTESKDHNLRQIFFNNWINTADINEFYAGNQAMSLKNAIDADVGGSTDVAEYLKTYLGLIDEAPKDVRYTKKIDAFRFDPPFKFTKNTTEKNVIRNVLMPYHRHKYENCGFWYTNYNTLNFFDNNRIATPPTTIQGK